MTTMRALAKRTIQAGLISMVVLPVLAEATPVLRFTTKIFDQDSKKQKLLFTSKSEIETKDGVDHITNTFAYPDGKVAAVESAEIAKDNKVAAYRMRQLQLGAEGAVEVKDGKANFSWTQDGKTKADSEKVGDDFAVGPALLNLIGTNWPKLQKGEALKIRLAVLDRKETVGFELVKDKETDLEGRKTVVIKMKPSAFLIAALVKPLYFYMSPDGTKLFELHGRTLVKLGEPGKWKDLDAVVVYDYPKP